ncbi:NERD domain-containing protein [Clostridium intestinale]|uniref:NERD domain-containing protein n=1 Tax=Clostridium intestinale TaxID=36845 RepID=UPI002DD6AFD1|nr:NERD domain-containing protein [Clostridium intestinale]WRY52543.1 NERD domain-containing protein [Clostridium intestinale]
MDLIIQILIQNWYAVVIILFFIVLGAFKPKIKGFIGEAAVSSRLSKLNSDNYKVINNLMLRVGNKTTHIDHVVVSDYGVFVIETKNYKGWILGNEHDDYWRQQIYKRKEKLYNPIKQHYGHVMALKEILSTYEDIKYIPIVTFTAEADLKINTKSEVIYTTKLLKAIEKYSDTNISHKDKEDIYNNLLSLNVDSKDNRKTHVQAINNNVKEKNNKINNDICPRCGGNLVTRKGKYGRFKGCSNFPKCRFTAT